MFVLRQAGTAQHYNRSFLGSRNNIAATSRTELSAIDEALAHVESLIVTPGAGDPIEALAARIDVLRLQVYIVQDILRSLIEARSCEEALKKSS